MQPTTPTGSRTISELPMVDSAKAVYTRLAAGGRFRHPEHVGRWVNAGKRPTGMIVGESL